MFREALDTLPVAVIMAVVVSFGMKTAREPMMVLSQGSTGITSIEELEEQQTRLVKSRTSVRDDVTEDESLDNNSEVNNFDKTNNIIVAEERKTELFINRRPKSSSKVPFYTSADVPRLFVPRQNNANLLQNSGGSLSSGNQQTEDNSRSKRRISINHSSLEELKRIPGIGNLRAHMIIDNRPLAGFRTWDELDKLPGFGKATLAMIQLNAVLD